MDQLVARAVETTRFAAAINECEELELNVSELDVAMLTLPSQSYIYV